MGYDQQYGGVHVHIFQILGEPLMSHIGGLKNSNEHLGKVVTDEIVNRNESISLVYRS